MPELLEMLGPYRGSKIAIYGLSLQTEHVLSQLHDEFQIVGLLASYREEGTIYGRRIIPLSEAVAQQVSLILVVAQPGSCRTIVKHIGPVCKEHHIDLMDIRGVDLFAERKAAYTLQGTEGVTKARMMELICGSEVISVDMFDTLVMRRTLFSTDVHEMVGDRLAEKGIQIDDFCEKRRGAERALSRDGSPNLTAIYAQMLASDPVAGVSAGALAQLEWEIDLGLLVPRQELCDMLQTVSSRDGKEIYIVSDTYYTKSQLQTMLDHCGISFYTDILSSCEYHTMKKQGLFDILHGRTGGRRCLHIGDSVSADVESAKKHGLTPCKIESAAELLERTGYFGMEKFLSQLSNRVKLGMFAAKLFQSPFQFESKDGKIRIASAYDIGYLLIAPMITDFVLWFHQRVQELQISNVWFCARDGNLIKKLYDSLTGDNSSVYFLTSRTAAIRAGVMSRDDLYMHYSGTLQDQLWTQFGIQVSKEQTEGKTLCDFAPEILQRSSECRERYQTYLNSLPTREGDIAFFDFIVKGTSQMYVQRMTESHLRGLCVLRVQSDVRRYADLDIESFFPVGGEESNVLLENNLILEVILSSPDPSFLEWNADGSPVYAIEDRSAKDISCVIEVQNGIVDYFNTYVNACSGSERSIEKTLDAMLLSLMHRLEIACPQFRDLKNQDSMNHRTIFVSDMI